MINKYLLLVLYIFISWSTLSACELDEKKSIDLSVFNGSVQIPNGFVCRLALATDSDFTTCMRKIKGDNPSLDYVMKGAKGKDYYQESVPKKDAFRMVESIKIDDFFIEIWTPKDGMPLANRYYSVLISDDEEFLKVSGEDLSLWKKIFDSRGDFVESMGSDTVLKIKPICRINGVRL